ncbi:uncharacterized protein CcaverHIS019_0607400 [Cutaneotrichosporon cavernicola]|uniref:Zn(2)-C6 fungal-type domain-containing protein n=1 Tax=Cutaneotrichosporon cavernicola TaxID=279322 RepID=A0AA48L8U1_9TREE|nr:uncharacterized protein CcaverHIS019_0607400 [Cutaneotrichosporon cavernicola]BEI94281.1 hypothetical protein CcaverHIS019_0607400 [Cutaneotrichosporon cavernicola]BEJ02059.1 hypothetical protein CcaverHIS631_0607410 [Cutaneotrichosporon cavernicola]
MGRWGDPPPTPTHAQMAHLAGPRYSPAPAQGHAPHAKRRRSEDRPLAITCTPCRARKIKCDSTKPTCDNCAKNPAECVYPVKLKPGLRPGTGTDMTKRVEALEEPTPMDLISPEMALDLGFKSPASAASFLDPHLLPPDDIVRDLIALYFSHIAPWAPIIPPQSFTAPWNIIVYAIVVVTLRLSNDPRIASTKQQYRQTAKSHVLSHAIESTSISSVQALALLALDLIGSEQGPSSWGILALLTRSAVHLGLITEDERSGKTPPHSLSRTSIIPPPADWGEDEARRRLFWLIFCLDRYACVSTGWDFALPDFEIKRCLPCRDELWLGTEWQTTPLFKPVLHRDAVPDPSQLSPMAYLVEALDLLGRAHTLQTRTVEPNDARQVEHRKDMTMTLTTAARRWFADLPDLEAGSMSLVIQAIYHATLLKLNAYYAYPALGTGTPPQPYGDTCITSARALAQLCGAARELGFIHSSSPLFVWSTWVAARVLFVNDFLAHRDAPCTEFEEILAALKEQAPYWSLANQYTNLLERAKRKWSTGSAYDAEANPSLPDAIHVLLDLRRTAYSAVGANGEATPYVSPPDVSLSHLPAWAVQPLLGDLHNWFDLPAGLFTEGA